MNALVAIVYQLAKFTFFLIALCRAWMFLTTPKFESERRLKGKVVVILVDGPGPAALVASEFMKRGARVIMGCPNIRLMLHRSVPTMGIYVREVDIFNLSSVRAFASKIAREEKRVDILINSCEVLERRCVLTPDGFDRMQQSIFFAPFILTDILLPLLKKNRGSRIITLGSLNLVSGSVENDMKRTFFRQSKGLRLRHADAHCAVLMWCKGLALELANAGVTVNVAHAGIVYPIYNCASCKFGTVAAKFVEFIFGKSVKNGFHTFLYLGLHPIGESETGRFFFGGTLMPNWFAKNSKAQLNLVKSTRRLLRLRRK